jgi:hypothetical protein
MRPYRALALLWEKFDKACTRVAAGLDERDYEIEERAPRPSPTMRPRDGRQPAASRQQRNRTRSV